MFRDLFSCFIDPPIEEKEGAQVDQRAEKLLHDIFEKLVQGQPIAKDVERHIDMNTRFYVLGLAPNAARLSVRFFLSDSLGTFLKRMASHHAALEIQHSPWEHRYLPLWALLQETVSPKAKSKASSPLLSGAVLRSILSGQEYPQALFANAMLRIRAERDVSRGKAAIIKAYLLRNHKENYKGEATVALNENSDNKAYLLGRLFAVLEKAQQDANPGINATIKDRYFTSACATPAAVYPVLLRLSNHHIAKAQYGYVSERRIRDLLDKLEIEDNPLPSHLNLPDQGAFILGYYHQLKANYAKSDKEEKKNGNSKQV